MESKCLCGTELKKILSWFGIRSDGCGSCQTHADFMDHAGCDFVENNIDMVVMWLRGEAILRGIPFVEPAAKAAIRLAIHNARKASNVDKQ